METRQSLAQKSWAKWKQIRDKFSEGQWRLLLLCLVVGFSLAFTLARREEPKKTAKVEPQAQVTQQIEKKVEPETSVEPEPLAPEEPHSLPSWPVDGQIVREEGWYRSESGDWRYHSGLDIAAALGTAVRAATSGKIIQIGQEPILGQFLKIEAADTTITYGHLSAVVGKVGETVGQNQVVAYSGESGACSRASVHFSISCGGQAQDPKAWIKIPR